MKTAASPPRAQAKSLTNVKVKGRNHTPTGWVPSQRRSSLVGRCLLRNVGQPPFMGIRNGSALLQAWLAAVANYNAAVR